MRDPRELPPNYYALLPEELEYVFTEEFRQSSPALGADFRLPLAGFVSVRALVRHNGRTSGEVSVSLFRTRRAIPFGGHRVDVSPSLAHVAPMEGQPLLCVRWQASFRGVEPPAPGLPPPAEAL